MSIATQLQAYEDGLSDAYDMVAQRGGTIPAQKNMNNLDAAIATIPSGGTPVQPTLTSATYSNGVITLTGSNFGSAPVVKMFNRKYDRYDDITPTSSSSTSATIAVGSSDYGYYSRVVKVENGGFESGVKFVYADFENLGASGPEVVLWCYHNNSSKYPLDEYGTTIASCSSGSSGTSSSNVFQTPYTAGFPATPFDPQSTATAVTSPAVRGFEIKTGITTLACGGVFLGTCKKLSQPVGLADVTTISSSGRGFLGGCTEFNAPIDTGRLENFGTGFLTFCSNFNQPLDLSSAATIGEEFLRDCMAFDQELSFVGTSGSHISISAGNFLRDAVAQSKTITFEYCDIGSGAYFIYDTMALKEVVVKNITITASASAFSVNNRASNCPAYGDGIMISGDSTSVNTVLTQYPDQATTSGYRHLVQGTIS